MPISICTPIYFNRILSYYGRHSYSKSSGLDLGVVGDVLIVTPLTSKGAVSASCNIEVPIESIPYLVERLTLIYKSYGNAK